MLRRHRDGEIETRQRGRRSLSLGSFAKLDKSAVLFLIYLYCLIHWVVRVLIAPVYTIEEAKQLLFSQTLNLGYAADTPPFLSWLLALVSEFPGISTYSVFGLKYMLLGLALSLYYLAARNVLTKPTASAAALAGLGLTYSVGWGVHEDMFDAVAMMTVLSLCFHAVTRILTWRRTRDWAYLGISIGLGMLTNHLFIILPAALILSIIFSSFFRDALSPLRLVLALALAALVYSPYGFWLFTHYDRIGDAMAQYAISWSIDADWTSRAINGALSLARTMFASTLPLTVFWATLFWTIWLPILYPVFPRRSTDEDTHETAWRSMLATTIIFCALSYIAGVLVGIQTFKTWWMMPVLYPIPIWMAAHVKRAGEFPVATRAFAAIFIIISTTVFAGRFIEWRGEIEMCDEDGCRPYTPIAEWADQLRANGFSVGTIVGADPHLTGNLRGAFTNARVLDASESVEAYPPASSRGACLAVWRNYTVMPEALADYLVIELKAPPRDRGPEGAIRRNFHLSDRKASTLYFQFVPPSSACR